MANVLYCGDNLEILRVYKDRIPTESIDLVYLDPPFNSQRTYNLIYKGSRAQEEAFKDYWSWAESAPTYEEMVERASAPRRLRTLLKCLHTLLIDENSDLLAYLVMMSARLLELHRVLKTTGSLYLHSDPTASHYLKLILDSLFGVDRFVNEIVWRRTHAHGDSHRGFGDITDTLLLYSKSKDYTFNTQSLPFDDKYIAAATKRHGGSDAEGRVWQSVTLRSPSPRPNLHYPYTASNGVTYEPHPNGWSCDIERMRKYDRENRLHYPTKPKGTLRLKMYWDEPRAKQRASTTGLSERAIQNLWSDIPALNSSAKERIGYPTQKPLALLDRVILASSNTGDLILDPFCGCGTTIESAERLGRRWIGIDIARKAVEIVEKRFERVALPAPTIVWHPADVEGAAALAERDPRQFEYWALRKVGARRMRKTDGGIDGEAFFQADDTSYHVLVSVKSGRTLNPGMVRDLSGTMTRENAAMGVLVSMHPPTDGMRREATHSGFLPVSDIDGAIPRIQFLTVEELFNAGRIRAPGRNTTKPQPVGPVPMGAQQQLPLGTEAMKAAKPRGGPRKVQPSTPPPAQVRRAR